jgi:hypothetical protein
LLPSRPRVALGRTPLRRSAGQKVHRTFCCSGLTHTPAGNHHIRLAHQQTFPVRLKLEQKTSLA